MKEFRTLMSYVKDLKSRYFKALSAFYAYEGMRELIAVDVQGNEKAQANAITISKYNNFFVPAQETLRVYFFLELAKLFDVSDQSLQISKVVNFTEKNLEHLNVDALKEYNSEQGRAFLEDLVAEYRGITLEDLKEWKLFLDAHKGSLKKLKDYRDSWIAHEDIDRSPEPPKITGEEIKALFEMLGKILNSLSGKLNRESTSWDHVERNVKGHTRLIVEYLQRFEPYRLKEIEAEIEELHKQHQKPS